MGTPEGLTTRLELKLGKFPFHTFWGPSAGLASTEWIAHAAGEILDLARPELTLVYLPHLDYDPQRLGPEGCDRLRLVHELDTACAPLLDRAQSIGARVWVVNEYSHCGVRRPVMLNRTLREAGLLVARPGPFGETLDTFTSDAFAVCDHQLAHVYVTKSQNIPLACELLAQQSGVARVLAGRARHEIGLDHPRAGEIVVLSEPDSWFAYPYWLDDRLAPDFARTVDIHRKPGYDPCELLLDPKLIWPKARIMRRLIQKKLGFRTLFDVVPLNPNLVKGSHGLRADHPDDRPILIGDGPPPESTDGLVMTDVHRLLLEALLPD
jgi:predicted AlkP superfamily pyrophosphatase or phosphodiesterase